MRITRHLCLMAAFSAVATAVMAAPPSVGAAPEGDAAEVASRIIKEHRPTCQKISGALRRPDGTITATCDRDIYLVFTVHSKEGEISEIAMNCTAAKRGPSTLSVICP